MAKAARPVFCELNSTKPAVPVPAPVQKVRGSEASDSVKIVLQPRLCTLRSYGSDRIGVMRSRKDGGDGDGAVSPFFAMLQEYIESSKKSEDFETISGRLAMIVFAATITMEEVTGNSLFRKMDVQGIAEAIGVCLGAVTCAAIFAWFSSARKRVGRIFTLSCNTFIDSLIDQIVDGLFYEGKLSDWSDLDTNRRALVNDVKDVMEPFFNTSWLEERVEYGLTKITTSLAVDDLKDRERRISI